MVINVSVQHNGGLLPDIILLTPCDSIGEPFFDVMSCLEKNLICPYSQCSNLFINMLIIFPLRMDAQKVFLTPPTIY